MTHSNSFFSRNARLRRGGALTALALVGFTALAGCGGDKVNGNSIGSTTPAGPVAYGLEAISAVGATSNQGYLEVSGLGSPDGTKAYITAAVASTAKPLPGLTATDTTTIPLGFAPGGQFIDSSLYNGVAAGTQVVFRASISNGQTGSNGLIPIDPSRVVLTSSELEGFQLPLTFTNATTGPLANATYTTASFALPFATTGLHSLTVSVADTSGQSSTTTYVVPVVAGTDAGILAQLTDASDNVLVGGTATITNATGVRSQTTADSQGMVALFSTSGAQTITVKSADGTVNYTANVALVAGQFKASDATTGAIVLKPGDETAK